MKSLPTILLSGYKARQCHPIRQYAARAVEFLQKVQAAGSFKDSARVEELKKDNQLDALRAREDFQKLLKDLEEKAGAK